jgi:hypothetical protein
MTKNQLIAKKFLDIGLNPVPVKLGTKIPTRKNHTELIKVEDISNYSFDEIGVSTGYASGNLEVLDFDLKNCIDPVKFVEEFELSIPIEISKKLVCQTTPSGGRHYLYKCSKIESNQKLARNKDGAAMIETRGIGGYIKCSPSSGYKLVSRAINGELINNTFTNIPFLTEDERQHLIVISKQKDELYIRDAYKRVSDEDKDYLKKFKDFNLNEDIGIQLLKDIGWTHHSTNGIWYNMTRPNSQSGDLHGGYNTEGKFFICFSTAEDMFQDRRVYNNHHLFAEIECEGRYNIAYAKLHEAGYGNNDSGQDDDIDLPFVSKGQDEDDYLEQARKGEIPIGLSLGWSELDDYVRLKKNSFVFILGLDNIGKSTFLSSVMVSSKILHGFKWGISSPESSNTVTRRNLIEAQTGKKIEFFKDYKDQYNRVLKESRDHFFIIKNEKHYSIDEILEIGKKLYQRYGIDVLLIDPFSFYSGSGNYADDTDILSKIRVFSQNYCTVIVIDHPYTNFTRNSKDSQTGYLKLPTKYDASGGNGKANRCDDFISIHRVINHKDKDIRNTLQISVQKVKDKSTGGKPHIEDEYTELIWDEREGFTGYWDNKGNNPMYQYMTSSKLVKKEEIKRMTAEEAFGDE